VTVQNCRSGSSAGGATATLSNLQLADTRWINNTGVNGGALGLNNVGQLYLFGTNQFFGNTASISGGAIWLNDSAVFLDGQEIFSGNSVDGNFSASSANIESDPSSLIVIPYQGGPLPPFSSGTLGMLPVVYVDGRIYCGGTAICDGTPERPYNNLQIALEVTQSFGGQIYILPGVYSGGANVNLIINNHEVVQIAPWPNISGEVIFDCMNEFFGFITFGSYLNFADVTYQNCTTTSTQGGGAIFSNNSYIGLTNVNFYSNSAPSGSGGAIFLYNSAVNIVGGAFEDNLSHLGGGALTIEVSTLSLSNGTLFVDNVRSESNGANVITDLECVNASLTRDGTVEVQVGQLFRCSDSFQSKSALAIFPGSLNTVLYPKNASGDIQGDIYAGLDFESIVELDNSGTPIEATRLTKSQLSWGVQISNTTHGQFQVEYDAFGPNVQFLSIIHTFFYLNGTFFPFGEGGGGPGGAEVGTWPPLFVEEGTIKTTIEIALWPFQSPSNSLLLTLFANSHLPITFFDQKPVANGTSFTIKTEVSTISFGTLDFGVYDDLTKVGPVNVTASQLPNGVVFGFQFSFFELWAAYDPQFGVILGGTGGGDASEGDGSLGDGGGPSKLLLGLSIGLPLGALLFIIVGIPCIIGAIISIRMYRRHKLNSRVNIVHWGSDENIKNKGVYKIMQDEEEDI